MKNEEMKAMIGDIIESVVHGLTPITKDYIAVHIMRSIFNEINEWDSGNPSYVEYGKLVDLLNPFEEEV